MWVSCKLLTTTHTACTRSGNASYFAGKSFLWMVSIVSSTMQIPTPENHPRHVGRLGWIVFPESWVNKFVVRGKRKGGQSDRRIRSGHHICLDQAGTISHPALFYLLQDCENQLEGWGKGKHAYSRVHGQRMRKTSLREFWPQPPLEQNFDISCWTLSQGGLSPGSPRSEYFSQD